MKSSVIIGILAVVFVVSACSEYRKVLKTTDMQYKYDMALQYYKDGKYVKAYPLFDELYVAYRGTDKAEKIAYYQAKCGFELRDYALGAHRFSQFYKNYPSSQYAEECQFLSGYCIQLMSPKYSLDQSETYRALKSFQLFAIQHPESDLIDSCNTLIDRLREKIEYKDYRTSKLYYRMESYRAAQLALKNFNRDYPNSKYKEECWFLEFKSGYLLAINSVDEKKIERIEEAKKAYVNFVDRFSSSKYLKEAESLYEALMRTEEDV